MRSPEKTCPKPPLPSSRPRRYAADCGRGDGDDCGACGSGERGAVVVVAAAVVVADEVESSAEAEAVAGEWARGDGE